MSWVVVPLAMLGSAGVIAIEASVAGVIVSVVDPEMPPDAAVIVVVPAAADAARPFEPAALLMVATAVFEEAQVTEAVRFWVVLSE